MPTIIRGHATDLIKDFGDIDLCVTDPPYAFTGSGPEHEMTATVAVVLRECAKRLKAGSWMLVFCASSWRSVNYTIESVRGILDPIRFGVWVKPNPRSRVVIPGWKWGTVNVIAFRKGPKNRQEIKPSQIQDSIICEAETKGRRAILPEKVCLWAVAPFAFPGGVFLDPFSGSGRLPLTAKLFGMQSFGFEIQEN
jgi:DNA modification methylase